MHKFIITHQGTFHLGDVSLHKNLLSFDEDCLGGGYFEEDWSQKELYLSGASYDFGIPQWDTLRDLSDTLSVPDRYRGWTLRYHFEDQTLQDFILNEHFILHYSDERVFL